MGRIQRLYRPTQATVDWVEVSCNRYLPEGPRSETTDFELAATSERLRSSLFHSEFVLLVQFWTRPNRALLSEPEYQNYYFGGSYNYNYNSIMGHKTLF